MSWKKFADHRDRVTSFSGGWTIGGETMLHGYSIHSQLIHETSWMQSMVLAVTGRLYPKNECDFIESLFIVTGYPDPRLWCNRVAALAGNARCTSAASLAIGISSAEARVYGRQADYHAACIIRDSNRIYRQQGKEALIAHIDAILEEHRFIYGFGRPLTRVEERIAPSDQVAEKLGIEAGEHLETACLIAEHLKKWRIIMNYGGYLMSRLLDMGFVPKEIHRLLALIFHVGVLPCYIEAFENEPGTFLPIACEDILYEGRDARELPV